MGIKIKMVVFDMAGTTVNENNIVYKTVQKAINEAGFNCTLEEVLAEGAGKEKLQAIKSVLKTYAGNTDEDLARQIYSNFSTQLTDAYKNNQLLPQPNATELFAALKERNILRVLNTGYSRQVAQSIIDALGWQQGAEYDELVTATDVTGGRPEPDMIIFAADKFKITVAESIKVGDSAIDIEEGKNAGCALSIGITTGAHTISQLQAADPDYVINNLMELLPIIDRY
ncbi:HAD hydrolase-like protein [Mucilaginibacter sp. SMC90]|uniref:HAD hydrolase-like protein n=1 Tax=Mucilaginibacter sp. SMC90 TaxID=2929803 RepID=UPI001FB3408D|nr:HAD hydrolase-like protein [Mucilaginibacter sp. SMC90]UOE47494.1 HAD hydrolase-like protein [Mucilaginibacter sp. SMC90]